MIRLNRIIEQNKEKSLFAVTNMLLLFSDSGNRLSKCWVCKQFWFSHLERTHGTVCFSSNHFN